jgi:TolA-binding protein
MRGFSPKRKPSNEKPCPRALALIIFASALPLLPLTDAGATWFPLGRAQRRYERCVELSEAKQFSEARHCIREFLASYPDSRWAEHLQFLDAKMETSVSTAQAKLHSFLLEFPDGPYSAEASFRLGEIWELKGEPENAQKYYARVYLYFGASEFRDEAAVRLATCMLARGNPASARRHLDIYLSTDRPEPWRTHAKALHADALYESGQYLRAQNEYKEIISEAFPPEEASPRCYVRIAEIYERNEEYEAALQAYRQFLNVFPDSIQRTAVEQRLTALASLLKVDLSANKRSHILEAGLFDAENEAVQLVTRLKRLGYQAYVVTRSTDHREVISVRLGPYESRDSALAAARRLSRETGIEVTVLP